ncbi:MAG: hypothetical protein K2X87_11330 [Gemmataceae bacterium]|nr:hypothetical protein [Gemmataceae bacterium]
MSPLDILANTRKQPFVPFRLVVSDGSTYDIRHPDLCLVAQTTVTVGIPPPAGGSPGLVEHLIDAFHIVKLIPLVVPPPADGGDGSDGAAGA